MNNITKLADAATFSKRKQSRKDRVVPWSEFEPYLNQLRQALEASQDDACRYVGYGGGSMVSAWQKEGAPIVAMNAFRWALHDLRQPQPAVPQSRYFTENELADLFDAVRGRPLTDDVRRTLVRKLAAELAR